MDFYSMTDKGIAAEIGGRIKSLRLRKNLTQQQLSEATALSLNTIKALEAGKGKIQSLIAILRELDALHLLEEFIPEPLVSPLQLAKRQGKKRKRASGRHRKDSSDSDEGSQW
ncbi:MAG: helix-turn-helix transcriptional regulator [Deltaproteobacteria bacterium]|nr:helix-turn-helix transcriptional regulator [Deltaproteobacteria bacterium]